MAGAHTKHLQGGVGGGTQKRSSGVGHVGAGTAGRLLRHLRYGDRDSPYLSGYRTTESAKARSSKPHDRQHQPHPSRSYSKNTLRTPGLYSLPKTFLGLQSSQLGLPLLCCIQE